MVGQRSQYRGQWPVARCCTATETLPVTCYLSVHASTTVGRGLTYGQYVFKFRPFIVRDCDDPAEMLCPKDGEMCAMRSRLSCDLHET
jgi:hypothetical protein